MKGKKILITIMKNNGRCSTANCHNCCIRFECYKVLNYKGLLFKSWVKQKKEIAIKKYIELYGEEELFEVLL